MRSPSTLILLCLLLLTLWLAPAFTPPTWASPQQVIAELETAADSGATAATPENVAPEQTLDYDLDNGAKVFEMHCSGCHINGGNIVRRGKNLQQKTLERNGYVTVEAIAQIVSQGKANMSAYQDRLTATEINDVAAYVLKRAEQNWK